MGDDEAILFVSELAARSRGPGEPGEGSCEFRARDGRRVALLQVWDGLASSAGSLRELATPARTGARAVPRKTGCHPESAGSGHLCIDMDGLKTKSGGCCIPSNAGKRRFPRFHNSGTMPCSGPKGKPGPAGPQRKNAGAGPPGLLPVEARAHSFPP